jgi:hypothetical protein
MTSGLLTLTTSLAADLRFNSKKEMIFTKEYTTEKIWNQTKSIKKKKL